MVPNDLLDDAGGFRDGLRGTLKFKEKGVLDWIRPLDYTGCVDGRHHYGSFMLTEPYFDGISTDYDRREAQHILGRSLIRPCMRSGWIRTYMRATRRIENFLNSANGFLDIWKLCHCDFRRNAGGEAKCSCFSFQTRT